MQRADNAVKLPQSVTSLLHSLSFFLSLFPLSFCLAFLSMLMRCDDNISKLLLALTAVGEEPLRSDEPLSKGILFIHCNASSHRKCENGGSELAMPQKKNTSSENNSANSRACDPVQEWWVRVQTVQGKRKRHKDKHRNLLQYAWVDKAERSRGT